MGRTQNKSLTLLSKEIWEYLIAKGMAITADYLPGSLNKEADFQSRTVKDSIEWKLNPDIFQMICKQRETPDVDLFASRDSHHVPVYMGWKLDSICKGRDAFQSSWTRLRGYSLPPFPLVGRALSKVQGDKGRNTI